MSTHRGEDLIVTRSHGGELTEIVFNRPHRHNAFTAVMYEQLTSVFEELAADRAARVVLLRGAGALAFAAGNDIAEFADMTEGAQAVAYERRVRSMLTTLADLPQVTIAAIDGLCVGGGLAVATYCDLRVATSSSRFGYPIARTLGNALSRPLLERCVHIFGESTTRQMLLASRLCDARRAYELGVLLTVCESRTELDRELDDLVEGILHAAPITVRTTKEQLRRISASQEDPVLDETLLEAAYGSEAFREGVRAFLAKERPDFRSLP
ncbi:Enoyl-CoA hydratase/carnithine racemase [Austwickia chelonae]|uniref:Putative enoyl-CoA hydratase n=1 Tax=Austwickia chelonae NBRC 105200 TaxID=1184607 RepID=K6VMZ3_9MICO|nr:enoyl-CoA hydratase [Austwickia chelonae]GAB78074.1 putative enoyl-CoA hydratase [Austwickia chelonae NBRC 105200]SEV95789.1 Enoyl-CoA hydratase/carnithine racemase [Austwickia chelonae]